MTIAPTYLTALEALGYTQAEARFLYLVATHSGYFVARQFLGFTGAHWGKRTTLFWTKLQALKHARIEHFPKSGVVYHLFARRLYGQIGREHLRNRREHEIEFVRRRIAMLDFVLANSEYRYLETEQEKLQFFCEDRKIPAHALPSKTYHGQRAVQPTIRYFVDKFPMFVEGETSSRIVTFSYVQDAEANLTGFVHHLEAYLPLFRHLPEFRFLYLARDGAHFDKARELFGSLVTIPLESKPAEDLLRYFSVRKQWDLRNYSALSEADLIFRNQARTRFAGSRFEHLYRAWKAEQVKDATIRSDFAGSDVPHVVEFQERFLPLFNGTTAKTDENR
jgi:hypothetical protein